MCIFQGVKAVNEQGNGRFLCLRVAGQIEDLPDYLDALLFALQSVAARCENEVIPDGVIYWLTNILEGFQFNREQFLTIQTDLADKINSLFPGRID